MPLGTSTATTNGALVAGELADRVHHLAGGGPQGGRPVHPDAEDAVEHEVRVERGLRRHGGQPFAVARDGGAQDVRGAGTGARLRSRGAGRAGQEARTGVQRRCQARLVDA
jgi:hypothetical protein